MKPFSTLVSLEQRIVGVFLRSAYHPLTSFASHYRGNNCYDSQVRRSTVTNHLSAHSLAAGLINTRCEDRANVFGRAASRLGVVQKETPTVHEIICESCPRRTNSESVSERPRPFLSRGEYEIDESVSGGSKGRFHRLTGSRQTKLTMNGQLTWRLCQLTAMADVTREPKWSPSHCLDS